MSFAFNALLTAVCVAGAVELAKRSPLLGAMIVSLPLSSLIALSLLYSQTKDTSRVAAMSMGIFWAVVPSLLLLAVLPLLLRRGWGYWPALGASSAAMIVAYAAYSAALWRFGVKL